MSTSVSIESTKVTFPNQLTSMAGTQFAPLNMEKAKKYPALVVIDRQNCGAQRQN
jgi:hypothetical protein